MALNNEQLEEIRTYMDQRATGWEAAAREIARATIENENNRVNERHERRVKFMTAVGGVTILAFLGILYNAVNSAASQAAQETTEQLLAKDKIVEEALSAALRATSEANKDAAKANVAAGQATTEAQETLSAIKGLLEELQGAKSELEQELEELSEVQSSIEINQQSLTDTQLDLSNRAKITEELLQETRRREQQLAALDITIQEAGQIREALEEITDAREKLVEAVISTPAVLSAVTASAAPKGSVVGFAQPQFGPPVCPSGWTYFQEAENRFMLGASEKYQLLETGGEEAVTLTVREMPNHNHGVKRQSNVNAGDDNAFLARGESSNMPNAGTTYEGGGQPHNNMPPYIALYFCKKD